MRLVLYTGKGGVGKTTTAAATAACAAGRGLRTLVVSADAAHSLGDVLGEALDAAPRRVAPRLEAVEIDPRVEVDHHYGRIRDYLVSLFRYQGIEGVVADELALLPGAEEITTLLAVEEHAAGGAFDLVIVDCAPTDSTLRLVTLPDVAQGSLRLLLKMQRAVSSVVTPIARGILPVPLPDADVFRDLERLLYQQLRQLRRRITAPSTSVRLVVTPERLVIDEARRAQTQLSLFEVGCDAVVMNRLLPASAAREPFFREWGALQQERLEEVKAAFAPLPVLGAPLQEDEVIGPEQLAQHGAALFGERDPAARLCTLPGVRYHRSGADYSVQLPLPGANAEELDVSVVEGELVVRAGAVRRALALPPRIARLPLAGAALREGELSVHFRGDASGPASPSIHEPDAALPTDPDPDLHPASGAA